jgi:hypothetical protein
MKSICKSNFFDDETFNKIKKNVLEKINDKNEIRYSKEFRRYFRIVSLPDDIKDVLLDIAKQEVQDQDLEIIYSQVVRYQIKDGAIPELREHKDSANGEWVMDIVIDATVDWPLVIDGQSFSNIENSVFFIKGEEDLHSRPDFPSQSEDDYVLLLFVHLANKDTHYARISREIFSMDEKNLNTFLRVIKPAWGEYEDS